MSTHFNKLSAGKQERLSILAEECGEVVHVIGKILRHGMQSRSPINPPQPPNESLLAKELGDLKWIVDLMVARGDVSLAEIDMYAEEKPRKAQPYLHHQATKKGW